jgi:acyl-CoA thioester hydrolase
MGVVHHTHYLVWFELGRTELMCAAGLPYGVLEDEQGILFPVVEASARYRRPARYDEQLEGRTGISALSAVRGRFEYRIARPGDEAALAEGYTVHAAVDREGRPRRLPPALMERLAPWIA